MDDRGIKRKLSEIMDEATNISENGRIIDLIKSLESKIDRLNEESANRIEELEEECNRIEELEDDCKHLASRLEKANKRLKRNKINEVVV